MEGCKRLHKKPWNYKGKGVNKKTGYVWVRDPSHHYSGVKGNVFEHRLIWEKYHNAILLPWAIVHHINGNRLDNRIENLEAHTRREHNFIHKPKIDMSDRFCYICKSKKARTYKHKNGLYYDSWYKDINGWMCRKCYRFLKRKG